MPSRLPAHSSAAKSARVAAGAGRSGANICPEAASVAPRTSRVRVIYGGPWDPDVLADVLGERPHDLRPVLSPVLTVDGLVEEDATEWLAYVRAKTGGTTTAKSYAESLRAYASFLLDKNCSLRGATNAHKIGRAHV